MSTNKLFNISIKFLILALFFDMSKVYANLLITPTRIEFEQRDRSAKVSLVNTSQETKTYKVFWREQRQAVDGKYIPLIDNDNDFLSASSMIRYSPRQVTLQPGERQHIRLAVRKPKALAQGEYRSHLVFEAQPDRRNKENNPKKQAEMKIYINLAFSIPIIIRQGDLHTDTRLAKVKLLTKEINGTNHIGASIYINNTSTSSTLGSLKVFFQKDEQSQEKQIGILNNVAIYPEVSNRIITIGFTNHDIENGIMRIEYQGSDNFKGTTFFNERVVVTQSDYKSE